MCIYFNGLKKGGRMPTVFLDERRIRQSSKGQGEGERNKGWGRKREGHTPIDLWPAIAAPAC